MVASASRNAFCASSTCLVGSAEPAALKCVATLVPGVSPRVQSPVLAALLVFADQHTTCLRLRNQMHAHGGLGASAQRGEQASPDSRHIDSLGPFVSTC